MRVAPPQKVAPQLRHWSCGEVGCSLMIFTVAQITPSRLGGALGSARTRGAPGGAGVWSPRVG
eukprot:1343387-Prymnesium_polylepis.1